MTGPDEVAQAMADAAAAGMRLGVATVTAKDDGARTVTITTEDGTSVAGVRRIRPYSPTVGDVVNYLADPGGNWVVLG